MKKILDEPRAVVIAALITGICVLLATIPNFFALIPSFGQWLFPRPITQVTLTLTDIPTSQNTFESPLPSATQTVVSIPPTNTPTAISPSRTPLPSPTNTQAPSPTSAILFEDTFDNGFSQSWNILEGSPTVAGGKLVAAGDDLALFINNPEWTDYAVEMSYKSDSMLDFANRSLLGLHVDNPEQMIAYGWGRNGGYIVTCDRWCEVVPDTRKSFNLENFGKIHAVAQGGNFSVTINGISVGSMYMEQYQRGGVYLLMEVGASMDYFRITGLP